MIAPRLLVGCGSALLILLFAGILALQLRSFSPFQREIGQPRPTKAIVLKTATIPAATVPVILLESTASSTPAGFAATNTSLPSDSGATAIIVPADTQMPTPDNVIAAPTVKYPQGRHLRLYYNDNSFYIYSLDTERIAIEPIAFERLDASGAYSNRFEGIEWAKLYAYIWPNNCMKAEIRESRPFLNPSVCLGYNATRTFKRDEELVFWTTREGTTQFRVLWEEEEIARCEIVAGVCEVYLP
jgi:hypothetical protein